MIVKHLEPKMFTVGEYVRDIFSMRYHNLGRRAGFIDFDEYKLRKMGAAIFKNLRLTCWAFSQVIDLKFMITKTNCDFGRSWGTNIMRINTALEWEIWYIFPQNEDHPLYKVSLEQEMLDAWLGTKCYFVGYPQRFTVDSDYWTRCEDFTYPMTITNELLLINNRSIGLSHAELSSMLADNPVVQLER